MITLPSNKKRILTPQETWWAEELINITHGLGKYR